MRASLGDASSSADGGDGPSKASDGAADAGTDADAASGADSRDANGTPDLAPTPSQDAAAANDSRGDAAWTAPAVCALAFDPGPCKAAVVAYAFVDGACMQRTYGGCEGNGNRFSTIEECMATCEGRPTPLGCAAGRKPAELCVTCGAAGGCAKAIQVCAQSCDQATPCASSQFNCVAGVCQAASSCI